MLKGKDFEDIGKPDLCLNCDKQGILYAPIEKKYYCVFCKVELGDEE